jgi:hypothetical protein
LFRTAVGFDRLASMLEDAARAEANAHVQLNPIPEPLVLRQVAV